MNYENVIIEAINADSFTIVIVHHLLSCLHLAMAFPSYIHVYFKVHLELQGQF